MALVRDMFFSEPQSRRTALVVAVLVETASQVVAVARFITLCRDV
jgi:hypothetical protein